MKIWLRNILIVFLICQGVVLTFGLPPFQKPDETVHFTRTMALSRGQLYCKNGSFKIPLVWDNLKHDYRFLGVLIENEKFPLGTIDIERKWDANEMKEEVSIGGCELNFLGYIPNTIGVWLTSWTNNPFVIFYAGRIAGFVFLIVMLFLSLRIINKKFQYLLWFYGLLPMVVHQVTSFSYDVVIISLILPLTALIINKITIKNTSRLEEFFVWVIVGVMAMIKNVYLPLIFIYIMFGWPGKEGLKIKAKYVIQNVFKLILLTSVIMVSMKFGLGNLNYTTFINPGLQTKLILSDPLYFLKVVQNTYVKQWNTILTDLIGNFGWKNIPLNDNWVIYIFLIVLMKVEGSLRKGLINKIKIWQSIVGLASLMIIVILISLAMYLVATTVGYDTIIGIQGRYLLPLVPFILIFGTSLIGNIQSSVWLKSGLIALALVGVLVSIGDSLWKRYYDFSTDWVNAVVDSEIETKEVEYKSMEVVGPVEVARSSGGENVSGVRIELDQTDKAVVIPYRYLIKDENCNKVLRSGYLSLWGLQNSKEYVAEFRTIRTKKKLLCLEIEPTNIAGEKYGDYLNIKYDDEGMRYEWLFY